MKKICPTGELLKTPEGKLPRAVTNITSYCIITSRLPEWTDSDKSTHPNVGIQFISTSSHRYGNHEKVLRGNEVPECSICFYFLESKTEICFEKCHIYCLQEFESLRLICSIQQTPCQTSALDSMKHEYCEPYGLASSELVTGGEKNTHWGGLQISNAC